MTTQEDEQNPDIEQRIADLERRLESLEGRGDQLRFADYPQSFAPDRLWAVDILRRRSGTAFEADSSKGSLLYAGSLTSLGTGTVAWQIERPFPNFLQHRWDPAAPVLAALGHPVRLEIIRRLLAGARTSQELQEIADLRTTGGLYHHLRDLLSSGLIVSPRRNNYAIPTAKVVPCLIILAAASELASQVTATEEGKSSDEEATGENTNNDELNDI